MYVLKVARTNFKLAKFFLPSNIVEAVEALLEHKANVNAQNNMTGATPLHCAVQSMKGTLERRIECVDRLIAYGADVSIADFFGKTASEYCDDENALAMAKRLQPKHPPLFEAIQDGNIEQVQELLTIETSHQDGSATNHPLHEELFLGQTPFLYALDLLLADDDEENENGTAAHTISQQRSRSNIVEILKVLLESGANVNTASGGGTTNNNPMQALEGPVSSPLVRVCSALQNEYKNQNDAQVQILKETCNLLVQNKAQITPELEQMLHTACRKDELDFAKLLIDVVGINPNVKGRQGMTPLQFAARSGKVEMVQFLLGHSNIDISLQDDRGQTALDAARVNNKQDVVILMENFAKQQQH